MQELQIFKNKELGEIRTILIDNQPYFVGKDVAETLGYTNTNKAIKDHVDEEDKLTERIVMSGQNREVILINESGLYSLILTSKLPSANKFKRWVTNEVIPSIRKTGSYNVNQPQYKLPATYKEALLQLVEAEEEKERLQLANKQQEQIIGELKPKADYTDVILKSNSLVTITQIAKDYGMSGQEMNSLLHELKVQYKLSDQWLLYSKYHNEGYTHSETIPIKHKNGRLEPKMNTKWTQKGRLFLYELLKENGILPMIEMEDM